MAPYSFKYGLACVVSLFYNMSKNFALFTELVFITKLSSSIKFIIGCFYNLEYTRLCLLFCGD
ncbi:hypothetical protein SAMN05421780_1254 [Flexibacter flexilis DSM 6793]|uniref:Uncharacterized protein n=1 Tax=Flexibacter flexilis DSM 6793 TaxID=927664 RepID=A0A1I1PA90_9BACT|nr:hypothetical protein SAMN05421780_1254 [Flexibacter flexilis DSM 6793]